MFAFEYIQILYIPLPINVCIIYIYIYIGALDTTATYKHLLYGYVYYICTMRKLYTICIYV